MIRVVHSHPVWLPRTMTWLHNQVRYLPADRVESHIVCERTENLEQFPQPHIHALESMSPARRWRELAVKRLRLRRYLGLTVQVARETGAGVLHSHFGNIGWANLGAARSARLKHVVTFYGRDISHLPSKRPVWRQRYAELFAAADLILCEGEHMAGLVAGFGCPSEKLKVHHLGVSLDEIRFSPRTWTGSTDEPLRVLISGVFREKKGIPYAVAGLGIAARSRPVEATIIGDASSTPSDQVEKGRILQAVADHGLEGKVRFLGMQPHAVFLREAYTHHVFLSPSVIAADGDSEGGAAVSVIEMAATGMPVVATTHCDTPGVVQDGRTGLLAPERDAQGLADRLLWLADHGSAWGDMTTAARRHLEEEFDARRQGSRLADLYAGLLP